MARILLALVCLSVLFSVDSAFAIDPAARVNSSAKGKKLKNKNAERTIIVPRLDGGYQGEPFVIQGEVGGAVRTFMFYSRIKKDYDNTSKSWTSRGGIWMAEAKESTQNPIGFSFPADSNEILASFIPASAGVYYESPGVFIDTTSGSTDPLWHLYFVKRDATNNKHTLMHASLDPSNVINKRGQFGSVWSEVRAVDFRYRLADGPPVVGTGPQNSDGREYRYLATPTPVVYGGNVYLYFVARTASGHNGLYRALASGGSGGIFDLPELVFSDDELGGRVTYLPASNALGLPEGFLYLYAKELFQVEFSHFNHRGAPLNLSERYPVEVASIPGFPESIFDLLTNQELSSYGSFSSISGAPRYSPPPGICRFDWGAYSAELAGPNTFFAAWSRDGYRDWRRPIDGWGMENEFADGVLSAVGADNVPVFYAGRHSDEPTTFDNARIWSPQLVMLSKRSGVSASVFYAGNSVGRDTPAASLYSGALGAVSVQKCSDVSSAEMTVPGVSTMRICARDTLGNLLLPRALGTLPSLPVGGVGAGDPLVWSGDTVDLFPQDVLACYQYGCIDGAYVPSIKRIPSSAQYSEALAKAFTIMTSYRDYCLRLKDAQVGVTMRALAAEDLFSPAYTHIAATTIPVVPPTVASTVQPSSTIRSTIRSTVPPSSTIRSTVPPSSTIRSTVPPSSTIRSTIRSTVASSSVRSTIRSTVASSTVRSTIRSTVRSTSVSTTSCPPRPNPPSYPNCPSGPPPPCPSGCADEWGAPPDLWWCR